LIRCAPARDVQLRRPLAERLITAAQEALPTADAAVARRVLAADMALLADLEAQIITAEAELAALVPRSPFATLTSVPGWGVVRVANYAAALAEWRPTRSCAWDSLHSREGPRTLVHKLVELAGFEGIVV
jgi:transposase